MIYPTRRAILIMAAGAPIALAVGLIQPGYWVAAAAWVAAVGALCFADAVLGAPRDWTELTLDAPGAMPTAGEASLALRALFPRRPPPLAEASVGVNARLTASPERTDLRVRAGEGEARFTLTPVRRGEGEIERAWLRWRGPLGLVWKQVEQAPGRAIAITPNIRAVQDEAI